MEKTEGQKHTKKMNNLIFAPDENISLIIHNDENCDDDYYDMIIVHQTLVR